MGNGGSVAYNRRDVWSNENTLTYMKKINEDNRFDVLAGFSLQGTTTSRDGFTAIDVPNESLGIHGLDQGTPEPVTTTASQSSLESFMGRVNYNYKSKYLLTGTFRTDGSSRFAPANKWGYFPSGAFAWRMGNEPFMKKLSFVSDAKLRISYGVTGNNRVGDFSYLPTVNPTNAAAYSFNNQVPTQGVDISSLGNADLKWETTAELDLGYDLSLLKGQVELTVDVYRRTTKNLLLNADLPYNTGYSSVFENIGSLQNQGLEITLNTNNIHIKDFNWGSSFNISFNQNKILSLVNGQDQILNTVSWETQYNNSDLYISKVGQPAGQFYGYVFNGIYQLSDFDVSPTGTYTLKAGIPNNGNLVKNIQPGDIKYKDINGDSVVNSLDQTMIGRGQPIYTGGFSNDFRYKGFSLNVFFQWSVGNDIFNANRLLFEGSATTSLNQFATYIDRWTPDNPSDKYYKAGRGAPYGIYSTRVLEDGSYLRLKTVSLGYNIPSKYLKRAGITSLNVNVSAQNLLTWTKYSGMDPEVSVRNSVLTPGLDFSAYPHARSVVFGINLSF